MALAIGAAVASQLKTNTLLLFSSMIAATVGANNVFFSEKTSTRSQRQVICYPSLPGHQYL
ncbi:hypothetical protein MUB42_03505 [Apilactobacillus kunkeei]|nr:hypothetical protein MUB42_03505 [Apilactobacillus kunkeei]